MSADDDAVGYKRPPKQHQFKSGQSGNPRGRPKNKWRMSASELYSEAILAIGDELVEIRTAAGVKTLPMHEAIICGIAANALKGKSGPMKFWLDSHQAAVDQRYASVTLTDLLQKIAKDPAAQPDQLLLDTIKAQRKAYKKRR